MLDRIKCLANLALIDTKHPPVLQNGHRDRVGDHVVKFAGDPRPLGCHRGTRLLFLLRFQLCVRRAKNTVALSPQPHHQSGRPGNADER